MDADPPLLVAGLTDCPPWSVPEQPVRLVAVIRTLRRMIRIGFNEPLIFESPFCCSCVQRLTLRYRIAAGNRNGRPPAAVRINIGELNSI
jgi:hypothetical protein